MSLSWMRASLALVLLVPLAASAQADRGGYVIRSFDVELTVEPASDLVVTERVVVDFLEPRHGLYRTIPVRYVDPRGYLYSLGFRLIEVVDDDGLAHATEVTRDGRYVKVRIGSPDRTVEGRVVYTIRYRVRNALGRFAEHDELYWNATGNEWQARIERASALVRLPGEVGPRDLEMVAYTGPFGSRAQDASADSETTGTETRVRYVASRPLEPLEGLTVAVAWPQGLVAFPGPAARVGFFLADNWIVMMPGVALVFLLRRYWVSGRDPKGRDAVVVRYEPPADLTAGEVGALVDERVDLHDITASVVDLAVRGYIQIQVEVEPRLFGLVTREETWFEQTDKPRDDLRAYERRVLTGLFQSGPRVSTAALKHRFYRQIPGIRDALWDDLAARRFVEGKPAAVRRRWKVFGGVAAAATISLGYGWVRVRGLPLPHAMVLPVVSGAVVWGLFVLLSRAMPRRTEKGVESREWALGFEEFVDRVERDNLEVARRRNVFESLLPYAMALGVADAWARRFEGIYESTPPAWFRGHGLGSGHGFSTRQFESSLSEAMASAGRGMTSAPRSQGSSGFSGGSSGGGGGGGGGGSW